MHCYEGVFFWMRGVDRNENTFVSSLTRIQIEHLNYNGTFYIEYMEGLSVLPMDLVGTVSLFEKFVVENDANILWKWLLIQQS